jgi:hypothetical protein
VTSILKEGIYWITLNGKTTLGEYSNGCWKVFGRIASETEASIIKPLELIK